MAEIRFHPEAQEEFEAAFAWYWSRSPRSADRFEAELDRVLETVKVTPSLLPAYDEEHRFAVLRRFPFSVIFSKDADLITVVALAHSRRSPGYWRGRD